MKKKLILILDCIIAFALFFSALFGARALFTAQAEEVTTITTPDGTDVTLNDEYFKFLSDIDISTNDANIYSLTFYVMVASNVETNIYIDYWVLDSHKNILSKETFYTVNRYIDAGTITTENGTALTYFVYPITVTLAPEYVFEKIQLCATNERGTTEKQTYGNYSPTTSLYEKWSTIDDLQAYGYSANASATISAYVRSEQAGYREKVNSVIDNFAQVNNAGNLYSFGESYNFTDKILRFTYTDLIKFNIEFYTNLGNIYFDFSENILKITYNTEQINIDDFYFNFINIDDYSYLYFYMLDESATTTAVTNYAVAVATLPNTDDYTDELEQSNSELRSELAELYELIAELEDKLATAEAKILELNNTIAQKQREITTKQAEIDRLNGIITSLTQERNEYKEDAESKQEIIDGYKANYAELTGERDKLLNDVATLEAEKEALEETLNGDNAELITLYQQEKQKADNLQRENETLKKQNDELKKELEANKNKTGTVKVGCNADASESVSWIIPLIIFIILPQLVIMRFFKKETNKNDENNV